MREIYTKLTNLLCWCLRWIIAAIGVYSWVLIGLTSSLVYNVSLGGTNGSRAFLLVFNSYYLGNQSIGNIFHFDFYWKLFILELEHIIRGHVI